MTTMENAIRVTQSQEQIQQLESRPTSAKNLSGSSSSSSTLVLSVMSQKGGVGKSTVTVLLANLFFFKYGLKVCIIDADYPQCSISKKRKTELDLLEHQAHLAKIYNRIYRINEDSSSTNSKSPYPIIATDLKNCARKITTQKSQADKFDIILVDAPGTVNQDGLLSYMRQVSHFMIPTLQDDFSIKSALEFYALTHQLGAELPNYKDSFLFFNKVPHKNKLSSLVPTLQGKVNLLDTHLSAFTQFERTFRSTLFPIPHKENLRPYQDLLRFTEIVLIKLGLEDRIEKACPYNSILPIMPMVKSVATSVS